jgi:hypothetical protein
MPNMVPLPSCTLRQEERLWVLENRDPGGTYGPEMEDCQSRWLAETLRSWVPISLEVRMFACVYSVFVLSCVQVARPCDGLIPHQGVLPTVYTVKKLQTAAKTQI